MKKRPAKKTAHTPKRKYKSRKKPDEIGGGVDQIPKVVATQLLQLEKVDIDSLGRPRRIDAEIAKMKDLVKIMKAKEGFIVKKSWVKHIYKIVQEAQLKIVVRSFPVAGNDKVRRMVRLT